MATYTSSFAGLSPKQLQQLINSTNVQTARGSGGMTATTGAYSFAAYGWTVAANPYLNSVNLENLVIKDDIPKRRVTCQEHYNDICGLLEIIRALKIN